MAESMTTVRLLRTKAGQELHEQLHVELHDYCMADSSEAGWHPGDQCELVEDIRAIEAESANEVVDVLAPTAAKQITMLRDALKGLLYFHENDVGDGSVCDDCQDARLALIATDAG